MTVTEWLRGRLLAGVRIPGKEYRLNPEQILEDNFSVEFMTLMANRLLIGFFRYGPLRVPGRKPTQNIKEVRKRIALYEKTGNQEYLVDVANFAMVEFMKPCHPDPHFGSVDDGVHAEWKE